MNRVYSQEELDEAVRVFISSISKCEKAKANLEEGSPQKKYVGRQLEAFYIAVTLIENLPPSNYLAKRYTELELINARKTNESLISKFEKLLMKFNDGSPQKTLVVRRLKACQIAAALIKKELEQFKV